nr:hypothetical protein GCM10017610_13180 [Curtobacterium pusillum]
MHDRPVRRHDLVPDVIGVESVAGLARPGPDHPDGEHEGDGGGGDDPDEPGAACATGGAAVAVVQRRGGAGGRLRCRLVLRFGQFGAPGVIILIPG